VPDKEEGRMKFLSQTFMIRTERGPQFIDITEQIEEAARQSSVSNGFAVVFSKHTTAAIRINENEPALLSDMERMLEEIAPSCGQYQHNEFAHAFSNNGECPNGHSHCQHLLLGASEAVPIVDGRLLVGQWQRIFLIELDRARDREVVVQLVGE
jgi:secondary thiamine-phosphate synthase enzyme